MGEAAMRKARARCAAGMGEAAMREAHARRPARMGEACVRCAAGGKTAAMAEAAAAGEAAAAVTTAAATTTAMATAATAAAAVTTAATTTATTATMCEGAAGRAGQHQDGCEKDEMAFHGGDLSDRPVNDLPHSGSLTVAAMVLLNRRICLSNEAPFGLRSYLRRWR
jgi:hypothetical protein